jgi:hypothetical protein
LETTTRNLELDHRVADGVHVTLLWSPATDRVTVEVVDEGRGERFEIDVPKHRAMDAFHHPYAYAASDDYLEQAQAA